MEVKGKELAVNFLMNLLQWLVAHSDHPAIDGLRNTWLGSLCTIMPQ